MNVAYLDLLRGLMPEAIVALAILAVLTLDQFGLKRWDMGFRWKAAAWASSVGCVAAILAVSLFPQPPMQVASGMLVLNPVTQMLKQVMLGLAILTLLLAADHPFSRHPGEFGLLLLLAALGVMFLVSSEHLLMVFIALELTSLSLYAMAALGNHERGSAEAALKYFLIGGVATAFLLYGLSLVYGLTGETNLPLVASALAARADDPLMLAALVMVIMGFGFKIAAAPFHVWAPDVYEGAPVPAAAFIASTSKIGSFFVLGKMLWIGFATVPGASGWQGYASGWHPVIAVIALASMVWGNLAAIAQHKVRRLLAYSAVAHAGYASLAFLADGKLGYPALIYYVVTYALATLGAFGAVAHVLRHAGGDDLERFDGLGQRAPILSLCLMVFLLSLAGVPPLAGFFGKFYVFTAAIKAGGDSLALLWLVLIGLAASVVSLYYYLQVLKRVYVSPPAIGAQDFSPAPVTQIVLVILALLVLLLGCFPSILLSQISPLESFGPR
jgi:NADH-quinone oxidoreductase subunit N